MGGETAFLALSDRDHLSCVMSGHTARCSCCGTSAHSASGKDCRLGLILLLLSVAETIPVGTYMLCRPGLKSADNL